MNIVVTGSSHGIGRALALRLLAHAHEVWGLARSDQSSLATLYPTTFHAQACDVGDWQQVARAVDEIGRSSAHIDGLVTCAAVHGAVGPTLAADPDRWTATMRTNLDGTFHAIRACAGLLGRAPGRPKVICFSGGGATQARPNFSAYGAAKTGIVRLVETIAAEEARLDINALAPGSTTTRLTDEIVALGPTIAGPAEFAAALRQKSSDSPSPEKALDLVEWLLSPASDGITGRLLSARWDQWSTLSAAALRGSDAYMLRRVVPPKPDALG